MLVRYCARNTALIVALFLAPVSVSSGGSRTTGSTVRRPEPTRVAAPVGMTIVRTFNAQALAACPLGPDLTVTGATLAAAPAAVGAFTTGMDVLGLDAGVVLSTCDIDSLARTNLLQDMSTDNFAPGDPRSTRSWIRAA